MTKLNNKLIVTSTHAYTHSSVNHIFGTTTLGSLIDLRNKQKITMIKLFKNKNKSIEQYQLRTIEIASSITMVYKF